MGGIWWTLPLEIGNQIGELMNAPMNSVAIHGQCNPLPGSDRFLL